MIASKQCGLLPVLYSYHNPEGTRLTKLRRQINNSLEPEPLGKLTESVLAEALTEVS